MRGVHAGGRTLALIAGLAAVAGCASDRSATAAATGQPPAPLAAPTLFPGDSVRVNIWKEPDYSGTFGVDENGTIALPLLGPRKVESVTAEQLQAQLMQDYKAQLKDPVIDVTVIRRVSVVGAVAKPGNYRVDPTMRMSELIAGAGGVSQEGNAENVDLVRGDVEVQSDVPMSASIGGVIRSGDQVVVNRKSWISRNGRLFTGLAISTTAVVLRLTLLK